MLSQVLRSVLCFALLMPSSLGTTIDSSINNTNISGVTFGQYVEYNDISFTYSSLKGSISESGTISVPGSDYNQTTSTYLRCGSWSDTNNDGNRECVYYVVSKSATSNTQGTVLRTVSHSETVAITDTVDEYFTDAKYSYSGTELLNVHFDDNQPHSGTFQINYISQSQASFYSDNENVTVIGDDVYFYNVVNFNLKRGFSETNQTSLTHTLSTVTVANLQENQSDSLADIIKFFMSYTAPERMNALGFWKGYGGYNYYGNSGDYPSLLFETFPAKTSFFQDSKLTTNKGKLYIAFYHNRGTNSVFSPSNIKLHYENSNVPDNAIDVSVSGSAGMWCYRVITLTPNNDVYSGSKTFSIEFQGVNNYKNLQIVPLYVGSGVDLTDEEKSRFGIINDPTQNAIDDSSNALNQFNTSFNTVNENEQNAIDDFNTNINNLNFNPPSGESFVSSANFFKRVFTDFVGSTPLFTPIAVALMITLTMLILGAL